MGLAEISHERLKKLLLFDAETGVFVWKANGTGKAKAGTIAGHLHKKSGYTRISVDGVKYGAHRLAWFYAYGVWPSSEVDHKDGQKSNNTIHNLRSTDKTGNQQNIQKARGNSASKLLGVSFHKTTGKWVAQIQANCKKIHIGYFATPEEAYRAYVLKKRELHTTCTL